MHLYSNSHKIQTQTSDYNPNTVIDIRLKSWRKSVSISRSDSAISLSRGESHQHMTCSPRQCDSTGDPVITAVHSQLITWRLFRYHCEIARTSKFDNNIYVNFARSLLSYGDQERALKVLLAIPEVERTMEAKKLLIESLLKKCPRDVEAAWAVISSSLENSKVMAQTFGV